MINGDGWGVVFVNDGDVATAGDGEKTRSGIETRMSTVDHTGVRAKLDGTAVLPLLYNKTTFEN